MIVRIMGEGQLEIAEEHVERINQLDAQVEDAVRRGDEAAFAEVFAALLTQVRVAGVPVPDEDLVESEAVLPPEDATMQQVRELLEDSTEGLVPGR